MDDTTFFTVFRVVAGVIAGGVVVDNQMHSHAPTRTTTPDGFSHSTGGGLTFSPVVGFTDSTGNDRVVTGDHQASSSWVRGTTLQVLYDPDRPDRVVVDPDRSGMRGAVVAAALFLALAAAVVVGVGATAGWTGDPTGPDQLQFPGGQQLSGGGSGDLPPGFDQPADAGT